MALQKNPGPARFNRPSDEDAINAMAGRWDEASYRTKVARRQELVAEVEQLRLEIGELEKARSLPPKDPDKGIQSLPDDILMRMFTDHLNDQYQLEGVCTRWRFIAEATEVMRFRARWRTPCRFPRYLSSRSLRLPGGYRLEKAATWQGGSAIPRKNCTSGLMEYRVQGYFFVRVCHSRCATEVRVFKRRDHLWTRLLLNRASVNVDEKGGNVLALSPDGELQIMSVHTTDTTVVKATWPTAVFDGQIYRVEGMAVDTVVVDCGPFKHAKRYGPPPNEAGSIKGIVVAENYVWTIGDFGIAMYNRHTCECIQQLTCHGYGSLIMAAFRCGKLYVARDYSTVHIY